MTVERPCPVCDCDNRSAAASAYSRPPWIIKICTACGFVYLANPPEYASLSDSFAWEKTIVVERERRRSEEPVLQSVSKGYAKMRHTLLKRNKLRPLLRRYVPQVGARVLDVGCGMGRSLSTVIAPGGVPYGIEVSQALAERATAAFAKLGGRVSHKPGLDGLAEFADEFFDAVIMVSYLEHEAQPRPVLEQARRVLRGGGHLILKMPNFDSWNRRVRGPRWCGWRFPDHVNYFTPQSLTRLVTTVGFVIAQFGIRDRLPTSDNMWLVARRTEIV